MKKRIPLTRMPADDVGFSLIHLFIFSYIGSIITIGVYFDLEIMLLYQIITTILFTSIFSIMRRGQNE